MGSITRGTKLFIAALALDQIIKAVARLVLPSMGPYSLGHWLQLNLPVAPHAFAYGSVLPFNWIAAGLMATSLGLLMWAGHQSLKAEGGISSAWHLAAAGLFSLLIDRLVFNGPMDFIVAQLPGLPALAFNTAHLIALTGLLLVTIDAVGRLLTPTHSAEHMAPPPLPIPSFNKLALGTDNVHIDVRLSPAFCKATEQLIASMLTHAMVRNRFGERAARPTRREYTAFRDSYAEMLESGIQRAKEEDSLALMALMHYAAIKYLLDLVSAEFDKRMAQMRSNLHGDTPRRDAKKLALYQQVFQLAKDRELIEQQVKEKLFVLLANAEAERGVRLRQALFGHRWLLSREIIFNPLLRSNDPFDSGMMLEYYALFGRRSNEWRDLRPFEDLLERVFRRGASARPQTAKEAAKHYAWLGEVDWKVCTDRSGFDMQRHAQSPAADNLANVDILFDTEYARRHLDEAKATGDREALRRLRLQRRFERRAFRHLYALSRDRKLLKRIVAAYAMVPLFREHYAELNPALIQQYLTGEFGSAGAWQQIRRTCREAEPPIPTKPLRKLARQIRRTSRADRERYLLRFVRHFLAYRRDLRNYCISRAAMDQIRLLHTVEEVRLSRANSCLYEFLSNEEAPPKRERVRAHTIVKADLRGSTTVTQKLLEQGLNPATHFDRNFFQPIHDVLRKYGAEKVFTEGDAVIAAVLEYEDDPTSRTSIARACGLAREILEVVRAHNVISRSRNHPELQVGIGIAHQPNSPTYLYDGDQPVMISDAIGRADRLSSSSWQLREQGGNKEPWHVLVYALDESHPLYGEKGQTQVRYNVNGVLLEKEAHKRLKHEIDLRKVKLTLEPGAHRATFYVGEYPDVNGAIHMLVVRRGEIHSMGVNGPGAGLRKPYYEVIADPSQLKQIQQQLTSQAKDDDEETPPLAEAESA